METRQNCVRKRKVKTLLKTRRDICSKDHRPEKQST